VASASETGACAIRTNVASPWFPCSSRAVTVNVNGDPEKSVGVPDRTPSLDSSIPAGRSSEKNVNSSPSTGPVAENWTLYSSGANSSGSEPGAIVIADRTVMS